MYFGQCVCHIIVPRRSFHCGIVLDRSFSVQTVLERLSHAIIKSLHVHAMKKMPSPQPYRRAPVPPNPVSVSAPRSFRSRSGRGNGTYVNCKHGGQKESIAGRPCIQPVTIVPVWFASRSQHERGSNGTDERRPGNLQINDRSWSEA